MTGATFALAGNLILAGLFAATFFSIARLNPAFRRVHWFAIAYVVGMGTPASELVVAAGAWQDPFIFLSFASFAAALTLTAAALALYHRQPPRWGLLAALFGAALAVRIGIWGGPRNTLPYEIYYQMPFAVLTALCGATVLRAGCKTALDGALAAIFFVTAAHFLAKPFLAVSLGSGETAAVYVRSTYALVSQAGTGILLVAIGLLLVLVVQRDMLAQAHRAAEIDPLSQLYNRRGFDEHAGAALERARSRRAPVGALMCDLDHFKRVNDTLGHDAGDRVIQAMAGLLRACLPPTAVVGRTGGEEFAVLLEYGNPALARLAGEAIRSGLSQLDIEGLPEGTRVTVSVGIACGSAEEPLRALMQRADAALYRAKTAGRDRICAAEEDSAAAPLRSISGGRALSI